MLSSWGVEDRCMVDRMVRFVNELPGDDRSEVALACHETATIFSAAPTHRRNDLERERRLSRIPASGQNQ